MVRQAASNNVPTDTIKNGFFAELLVISKRIVYSLELAGFSVKWLK